MKNKYLTTIAIALAAALLAPATANAITASPSQPFEPPPPVCVIYNNDGVHLVYYHHVCLYWHTESYTNPWSNVYVRWL